MTRAQITNHVRRYPTPTPRWPWFAALALFAITVGCAIGMAVR